LTELVVVFAVIGVLAAIGSVGYQQLFGSAKDSVDTVDHAGAVREVAARYVSGEADPPAELLDEVAQRYRLGELNPDPDEFAGGDEGSSPSTDGVVSWAADEFWVVWVASVDELRARYCSASRSTGIGRCWVVEVPEPDRLASSLLHEVDPARDGPAPTVTIPGS
jgi:type II secretory pathway pseudopilin PulG